MTHESTPQAGNAGPSPLRGEAWLDESTPQAGNAGPSPLRGEA